MKHRNPLSLSPVYRGFKRDLTRQCSLSAAERVWQDAGEELKSLRQSAPVPDSDSRMMVLPAAARTRTP